MSITSGRLHSKSRCRSFEWRLAFGIYVYVDSDDLRTIGSKPHPFLEIGYGLDEQDGVQRIKEFFDREAIDIVVADKSNSTHEYVDTHTGRSEEYSPPTCKWDIVAPLESSCQNVLMTEFADLLKYHRGVSASKRGFQRSMEEMWQRMPDKGNPVLVR